MNSRSHSCRMISLCYYGLDYWFRNLCKPVFSSPGYSSICVHLEAFSDQIYHILLVADIQRECIYPAILG